MSRTRKIEVEYAEAIKFQDVLKELNFESIGEFVELIGGVMGMINVNDMDNVKRISEAFAPRIGYIIDKIGYGDKVIEKNKSMRDFYDEQQRKLAEAKAEKEKEKDSGITFQVDPSLMKSIKNSVGSEAGNCAQSVGGGWYQLPDGSKVRKKNIPKDVVIEKEKTK